MLKNLGFEANPTLKGTNETCVGWDCFQICPLFGNCSLTHKLRICDGGDLTFITNMGWVLLWCQVLAAVSFTKLSALADYEKLWIASKGSWFGLSPIVHRSLIYKFIAQKKSSKLREVLQDSTKEAAQRQNPAGYAPTTFAIKLGAARCLKELIDFGFDVNKAIDSTGMTPTIFAIKEGATECLKELANFGFDMEKVLDSTGLTPKQAAFEHNSGHQILMILVESGFSFRWWEDCHGLSSDGSSLIVNLAVEMKLDLLERILTNSRAAFPKKHNFGVAHMIFGLSDVGNCLENKEAVLLLVKNGLTNIDPENYYEGEAEAMVSKFKEQGGSEEVTTVPVEMWWDGEQEESSKPWSDRSAFKEGGGVTGVRVRWRESYGGHISEICLRHGGSWQPWRTTGSREQGSEQEEAFELEENEAVVVVRTNTDGVVGWLRGLEITTSTGRKISWGDLDMDKDYEMETRRSAVVNATLAFCSGALQFDGNGDGRRLTFHWVMD